MPSKTVSPLFYTKEKFPVELNFRVAIGATGAPTLSTASGDSLGVASIARTDTGDYTITLKDVWSRLIDVQFSTQHATAASGIAKIEVASETVASTKTILVTCLDFAGAAADPASGTVIKGRIYLRNSKN